MKKLNNYHRFGLLFNSIFLLSNYFDLLPEFFEGLCIGLCITLIFMGEYSRNHNMSNLRKWKMNFIKRC